MGVKEKLAAMAGKWDVFHEPCPECEGKIFLRTSRKTGLEYWQCCNEECGFTESSEYVGEWEKLYPELEEIF